MAPRLRASEHRGSVLTARSGSPSNWASASPQARSTAPLEAARWELRRPPKRYVLNSEVAAHIHEIVSAIRARDVLPISDPTYTTAKTNIETALLPDFDDWRLCPDRDHVWLDEHRVSIRPETLAPTEAVAVLRFIADHCTKQHTNSGRGTRIVLANKQKAPTQAAATAGEGDQSSPTLKKDN